MPQMFNDTTKLVVRFYSDAAGTNEVASAVCQDGMLVNQVLGTGSYTIDAVTSFSSIFKVSVEGLTDANYFNVYRDGLVLGDGTPVAINQGVTSMPQMFNDPSKLLVRFYSDAAGTTVVATAHLDNGSLIIGK